MKCVIERLGPDDWSWTVGQRTEHYFLTADAARANAVQKMGATAARFVMEYEGKPKFVFFLDLPYKPIAVRSKNRTLRNYEEDEAPPKKFKMVQHVAVRSGDSETWGGAGMGYSAMGRGGNRMGLSGGGTRYLPNRQKYDRD